MGKLADWLIDRALTRKPDYVIGDPDKPYLLRWWLIPRNNWFNAYLHLFLRSDDDRALHDHPWWNVSVLLRGQYTEHLAGGSHVAQAGDWVWRLSGKIAHRIELTHGPCWTLFLTGPRYRSWGFLCPQGWRHWSEFTKAGKPGEIGRGCE